MFKPHFFILVLWVGGLMAQTAIYNDGSIIYVQAGASVFADGDIVSQDAAANVASITNNGTFVLTGDLTNNAGAFTRFDYEASGERVWVLAGATANQLLSGSFYDNGVVEFFNLVVDKDTGNIILGTDIKVAGSLVWGASTSADTWTGTTDYRSGEGVIQTGINNELYLRNGNSDAVAGHEASRSDGLYANERYIYGYFRREISSITDYEFPIGDAVNGEGLNPVVLSINSGTGTALASFEVGFPGTISFSGSVMCAGLPYDINYSSMTGEGWWNLEGSTFDFDVMVHPNILNVNTSPNSDGQYRALKGPTGTGGSDWTSYALLGDECAVSANYYATPGEGYTGFSDIAIPGGGVALPVELIEFKISEVGESHVKLEWSTATETDNSGFYLERSTDGSSFEPISWIEGGGTSLFTLHYSFSDEQVQAGQLYYYRLRQINFNGSYSFSEIVSAKIQPSTEIRLWPNPSDNEVWLETNSLPVMTPGTGVVDLVVFDMKGAVVEHQLLKNETGNLRVRLNTSGWAAGVYRIKIQAGEFSDVKNLVIAHSYNR